MLPDDGPGDGDRVAQIISFRSPRVDRERQINDALVRVRDVAQFGLDGDVDLLEAAHRAFSLLAPIVAAHLRPGGTA